MIIPCVVAFIATVFSVGNAQEVLRRQGAEFQGKLLTSIGSKINQPGDSFMLEVRHESGKNSLIQGRIVTVLSASPEGKAMMELRIYDGSASRVQGTPLRLDVISFGSPGGDVALSSPSVFTSTRNGNFVVKKGTILWLRAAADVTLSPPVSKPQIMRNASLTSTPPPRWEQTRDIERSGTIPVEDYW